MPGRILLGVEKGPEKGRVFTFDEHDTFIFGRAPNCHIRMPGEDATVSRHHFILEVDPPDGRLRDLGSKNGTLVANRKCGGRARGETPEEGARHRYPQVDLRHGDRIQVGETLFRVSIELPILCCDCSDEIPRLKREAYAWIAGSFICPKCRAKAGRAKAPQRPGKVEARKCTECGKDVSGELGRGRAGEYVCLACQEKARDDPAILLMRMMLQSASASGQKPPEDIGGYEKVRQIGAGGFGAVYLAKRRSDGMVVALKVMLAKQPVTEKAQQAFLREISVIRELDHPNCVRFFDTGGAGSGFYFVMEYCPGGSVMDLMKRRRGPLSVKEAVPLMRQAVTGLAHLHERGFVHRDLKPPNILLTEIEGGIAKVSDFGLAKNFDKAGFSGLTLTGDYAGTPEFTPRDQLVDYKRTMPAADVWSMGATFYFALTAEFPRDFAEGEDKLNAILVKNAIPIRKRDSKIPLKLAEVIDRSLSEDLEVRYPDGGALLKALEVAV